MNTLNSVFDRNVAAEKHVYGHGWLRQHGIFLTLLVLLAGCEGEGTGLPDGFVPNTSPDNQQPVAEAGPDATGVVGRTVLLDGSASSDPDNDVLLMQWLLESSPSGSQADIQDPNDTVARFVPDVTGTYVISLGVTDGGLTDQDSLTLEIAAAAPPMANAGADQAVTVSTLVRLDGSASTAGDNSQLSYSWSFESRPSGSAATLSNADSVNPTFTPDQQGTYIVALEVRDGSSISAADTVVVQVGVGNQAPVANAGQDVNASTGSQVILNGAASNDPNGDSLTYRWTLDQRPGGSSATLASATSAMPQFTPDAEGLYTASLIVNDGAIDSAPDQVNVTATTQPVPNTAPTANAGADSNVSTGQLAVVDGSASFDPEGDSLTYQWRFISRPTGSSATLGSANQPRAQFTADVSGSYLLELAVSDGSLSDVDRIIVTSANSNSAPVANAGPDQNVSTGAQVQLNGNGSSDPDGDALTYAWLFNSKPAGSSATLSQSTAVAPSFTADQAGTYVLRLTVNDGAQTSIQDSVTITASSGNSAPVADAGTNASIEVGETLTFDGRGSRDADGDSISFQWSLSSRPAGSNAAIVNANNARARLTADVSGTYVAALVVSDGQASSAADTVTITASSGNRAPIADAGSNQTIAIGATAVLNGTGSSDPDGDLLSYSWTLSSRPGGSSAALNNPTSDRPSLVADRAGTYMARLIVNDGQADSTADTVSIISTTGNAAPVADAGSDQAVTVGDQVQLSGSGSSDPDGDSLTYSWSITGRPSGSSASLDSTTSSSPRFTADVNGAYSVRLVVNDGSLSSAPNTVNITASSSNSLPTANAGSNQSVTIGQLVQLNGNSSSDPDGDALTYTWSIVTRPGGSSASLNNTSGASTSFTADRSGNYTVRLVVNDGIGNSAPDSVTISAAASNQAPTASAGADQSVSTGDVVSLNGSASSDPDGDALTYSWTLTARPSGSGAALANANSSAPQFTADVAGTYRVQLVVNDGTVNSGAAITTITATTSGGGGGGAGGVSDDFSGNGPLLGYTTNNASALPDVARANGRYRANLVDNSNDITLHFNNSQGRLDAKLVSFPFEYIAYNIGIGTASNSQVAPNPSGGSPFMFAGVQVHVTNLNSRNSAHVVVGHRGATRFTIEGKNTVNGSSSVNDDGANVLPTGRADIRIVGDSSRNLTVYWRAPNSNNSWTAYRGNGQLPGTQPNFGSQVYIGLITYAFRASSAGFVGTADRVELVGE